MTVPLLGLSLDKRYTNIKLFLLCMISFFCDVSEDLSSCVDCVYYDISKRKCK
jgi:hypothetical protein